MIDLSFLASKSWKTSTFALIGGIGAAVVGAMATGILDPNDFPKWVKGTFGLMSVIGTAGIGVMARDNNKTSDDVGAVNKPPTVTAMHDTEILRSANATPPKV